MINYKKVSFSGSLLKPEFSVYLWEIVHDDDRYYYVGMTGDNYYPSARSAIHRLSGHFERNRRSTQNQMRLAIQEKGIDLNRTEIIMHHWSISGFEPWAGSLKNFKPNKLVEEDQKKYDEYLAKRNKVLALENYLIKIVQEEVDAEKSLNKTQYTADLPDKSLKPIINQVLEIIRAKKH